MWRDDLHYDDRLGLWPAAQPRPGFSNIQGAVVLGPPKRVNPLGSDPLDSSTWTRPVRPQPGMFARLAEDQAKARMKGKAGR